MIVENKIKAIYFIILLIFSILINQYYGNIGINPIDSFFSFNSGYDILNGYYPFKDYWTITGPFIAFVQAFFFKIFGVNWFSYVFHASIINFILTISTFYVLYKFDLNIHFCFIYALLLSFIAYPSSGTPYVDHQSSYLSLIALYCFILSLKTNYKIYWFLLPIIMGISFLTKQAPTGHIFLIIVTLSSIYFFFNFEFIKIAYGIFGSILFLTIFYTIFLIGNISIISFFHQYILFPLSLGESRLNFLFPLEFERIFLRFKLIHLSTLLLIIISIKEIIKNYKYLISNDFLIIISLIAFSYTLIMHQLMTINGLFIYFVIPVFVGFSHIYFLKFYKKNNYILFFLLILSVGSTLYYGYKYVHKRDFMDLRNANIINAIDAQSIDYKLKGLKWITPIYPNNPKKEISNIKKAISIIKLDVENKMIITDYQFISPILSIYDFSPSQVWFDYHANPKKGTKYFSIYKKFFIDRIKEGDIVNVYSIKPLWGGKDIFAKTLSEDCLEKEEITDILDRYKILMCDDLKN